ncbi:9884_t:CDS:2, partial [Dentiscutata heterogama]
MKVRLTVNKDGDINITSSTLDQLYTPALLERLLEGVMRLDLIEKDKIIPGVISVEEIKAAQK